MFDTCGTLSELNKERQERIHAGSNPMEVNAAYNKAKRQLLESVPTYRKIPTYTGVAMPTSMYVTFPISQTGKPDEITITPWGVIL